MSPHRVLIGSVLSGLALPASSAVARETDRWEVDRGPEQSFMWRNLHGKRF